jgi:hypothetical protein
MLSTRYAPWHKTDWAGEESERILGRDADTSMKHAFPDSYTKLNNTKKQLWKMITSDSLISSQCKCGKRYTDETQQGPLYMSHHSLNNHPNCETLHCVIYSHFPLNTVLYSEHPLWSTCFMQFMKHDNLWYTVHLTSQLTSSCGQIHCTQNTL